MIDPVLFASADVEPKPSKMKKEAELPRHYEVELP